MLNNRKLSNGISSRCRGSNYHLRGSIHVNWAKDSNQASQRGRMEKGRRETLFEDNSSNRDRTKVSKVFRISRVIFPKKLMLIERNASRFTDICPGRREEGKPSGTVGQATSHGNGNDVSRGSCERFVYFDEFRPRWKPDVSTRLDSARGATICLFALCFPPSVQDSVLINANNRSRSSFPFFLPSLFTSLNLISKRDRGGNLFGLTISGGEGAGRALSKINPQRIPAIRIPFDSYTC